MNDMTLNATELTAALSHDGMVRVELDQDSPEWHEWRQAGVGASEAPTIMGENPFQTPLQLWAIKAGLEAAPDLSGNPHVQRGKNHEEEAREAFEADFGAFVLPVCGQHPELPWLRASLDGLLAHQEVLEIKCPGSKKMAHVRSLWEVMEGPALPAGTFPLVGFEELASAGLDMYFGQVQHQLLVAGSAWGCLYVYDVEDGVGYGFWIQADPDYQERLLEAESAFWEAVTTGKQPEPDPERDVLRPADWEDDGDASWPDEEGEVHEDVSDRVVWDRNERSWMELDSQIKALEAEVNQLKESKKQVEKTLVQMMGNHLKAEGIHGLKITRSTKRGSIDYKAAVTELLPDLETDRLEAFRRKSSESVTFTAPKK